MIYADRLGAGQEIYLTAFEYVEQDKIDQFKNETFRVLEINKYNYWLRCNMGKHFFDFEDGDFAHSISDNMAIDSDGDLLMRMGNNMAMDMDSGELHIISGWSNDEDDD